MKQLNSNKYINFNMGNKQNWKTRNEKYMLELENFLDKAQSIKDETLRKDIIIQMLKCDRELTNAAEEIFEGKNG